MQHLNIVFLGLILALSCGSQTYAQLPDRSPANVNKYKQICRDNIYREIRGMCRQAGGSLRYPYISPGTTPEYDMLGDWDSWLSNIALRQMLSDVGTETDKRRATEYEKGCILNWLSYCSNDGYVPINIRRDSPSLNGILAGINPWASNMHKPVLAQHAAFVIRNCNGDAEWLRDRFHLLQSFVSKYWNHHRHRGTGLLYWETDESIGVDNDPSTYYRPYGSSGSIFLNALMYRELLAMSYIAERLNLIEIADRYKAQALELQSAIRLHCWDPRDRFYYSVDLNLLPVVKPDVPFVLPGQSFPHVGQPRDYECLIQRISIWSGFMSMWAGICTREEAEEMIVNHYYNSEEFYCPAGVRTLSPLEKMYNVTATGNPSSWLGPVWVNVNYMVFRGLVLYGQHEAARDLAEKTVVMLGRDYERFGALHQYYLPENGEPVVNRGFQNWNYLVLNMIAWLDNRPVVTEF